MPGAVPQVPRRMGIGRGVRTSCTNDLPHNPASPNVGLQQESRFSGEDADQEAPRETKKDFVREVSQASLETTNESEDAAGNSSATQIDRVPNEVMFSVSVSPDQAGGKLVAILMDRNPHPVAAQTVGSVQDEKETKMFNDGFANGSFSQPEKPSRCEPGVVKVKDIEIEQLEHRKMGGRLHEFPTAGVLTKEARDRRKAAYARFLRPALLQAQADRRNRIEVDPPHGSEAQLIGSKCSPTPSPPATTQEENLMQTTVSSELSNGHDTDGPRGGYSGEDPSQSAIKQRVLRALRTLNGNAGENAVSIPAPSVSHIPNRPDISNCSPPTKPPLSNPVTIKPMADYGALRNTDGTSGKNFRTFPDPNGVRGFARTNHQKSKSAHGAPGQECIKKKRRYAVGEWKSFLIKNFSAQDENSFAIWIVESGANEDLEKRLENIDCKTLNTLASHMLGGAAMVKQEEKFLRVMISDLRYEGARVVCADSGDEMEISMGDLLPLPQSLKSIPPLALRVVVESDRITNAKRFKEALQLAKEHQTVTQGCALTWDFTPKFVFRLPGCRALAVSNDLISVQWHQNSSHSFAAKQQLCPDLPGVVLPATGTTVKQCLVTHVEGSTVYITWEKLHNFVFEPAVEDLPLKYEVGNSCMVLTESDSGSQLRCCIESFQDETAQVRWIDCGTLFEVPREALCPLPASLIYPPGIVKATLANFQPEELECAGDDLSRVLLSLKDLQVSFLDSKPVPGVIVFTESFVEVKLENLEALKALCHDDSLNVSTDAVEAQDSGDTQESEQPLNVHVVGIAAFSQVWVVPEEPMIDLEDMEARLTRSKPADLLDCEPDTMCAAMHDNTLRRGLVRLRIGKRFLVRLVDRALDISASRIFVLPEEFIDFPTPCYCISVCPQQKKDAHFGRFIAALKRHPEVTLTPSSALVETISESASVSETEISATETSKENTTPRYFLTTPEGEDIMTAYGIRDQPR